MKINKSFLIIIAVILFLAVGVYLLISRDSKPSSSTEVPSQPNNQQVTIEGVYVCLPHKDTDGPQTLECALGLQTEDGIYYALSDTTANYSLTGSAATNSEIRVTGTLTLEESDTYRSSGTIAMTALEQL